MRLEDLKNKPIAILGSGAVGKTIAADCKLGGAKDVRLYGSEEFAESSLKGLDKTGILLDGIQRNRDGFERSGRAFLDLVSTDMSKVVKDAGIICICTTALRHEMMFEKLIPCLRSEERLVLIEEDSFINGKVF